MQHILIYSDGGSRGNPGQSAIGVFILDEDSQKEIAKIKKCIGIATNNIAEYTAVFEALSFVKENIGRAKISHFLDSELVVKQLNGEYKIKNPDLKEIYLKIRELFIELGGDITFTHVRREQNSIADALVNEALDEL